MKDRGLWPYLLVGSLVFLTTIRAGYLLFLRMYTKPTPARVAEYSIRVRKVEKSSFPSMIRVPGIISDRNVADIVSHAPGIVTSIAAPGTVLKKGEVLATIKSVDGKTKEQLTLRVTHAKEKLDSEYLACQNQILKGANRQLSQEEISKLERTASVRLARIEYEKTQEELEAHDIQTTIRAPYDARVDSLAVSAGSGVSHGARLCSVINLSDNNTYVECAVPYTKQLLIERGGKANFSLRSHAGVRIFAAEVENIGISSKNHPYPGFCISVKLLSKSGSIAQYAPKTTGDVCIFVKEQSLRSIPELAIDPLTSQTQLCAFRVTQTSQATASQPARGFAELVPIKILQRHYGLLAIESDYLQEGDMVSIDPILELDTRAQGQIPVLIVNEEIDAADEYAYDLDLMQEANTLAEQDAAEIDEVVA